MPWPFARRSGRSAKAKTDPGSTSAVAVGKRPASPTEPRPLDNDALNNKRTPSRRSSRRRRTSSRSSLSMPDADHNSPTSSSGNPPFAKHHHRRHDSAEYITALPYTQSLRTSPHLRPLTQEHRTPYNFQSTSHSTLPTARERGKLQRPQSLRDKRYANDAALVRRKSTKKRKNDPIREEEIRAMTMPLPQKRPAGNSGGLLRRESKKVKGGLNRHFERPRSEISLPHAESMHSSMSGSSESRAWRVSALDMFSPRPKIRCSVGSPPYYTTPSPQGASRSNSKKERPITVSQDGKESHSGKRIDDLADTLDAGALREILERDQRRRERKRKADDERLRRRLERRAQKQRAAEQAGSGDEPRDVGLGIENDTSTPMEDVRPSTPPRKPKDITVPSAAARLDANSQHLPTPSASPVQPSRLRDVETIPDGRTSSSPSTPVGTHARESSNVSHMPDLPSEIAARHTPPPSTQSATLYPVDSIQTSVASKKGSSQRLSSEGRRMSAFASFFRRGKRKSHEQGRMPHQDMHSSEVSFSNTSRESMSRQPLPPHLVGSEPIQIRRPSSTIPKRTRSKFREDLPEFPMSPPDSRMQSPDIAATSAIASRRRGHPLSNIQIDSRTPTPRDEGRGGMRTDSPVSVPPAGAMSQSLASIDSEGSWLSGKPMNRRSNKSYFRSSIGSSTAPREAENFNGSYEQLDIPDDEFFGRLASPDLGRRSTRSSDMLGRKASSTAIAPTTTELDEDFNEDPRTNERTSEEEHLVQQKTVERQPTVVHRQNRVQSREGLLSFFQGEAPSIDTATAQTGDSSEQGSPTSFTEPVSVQRATSVDLGKHHVRHLSAGSARLLDIPRRGSSVDQKRLSSGSRS